jgi:hypothetical protein
MKSLQERHAPHVGARVAPEPTTTNATIANEEDGAIRMQQKFNCLVQRLCNETRITPAAVHASTTVS